MSSSTSTPTARQDATASPWLRRFLLASCALSALVAVARVAVFARDGRLVPPYKATLFWVDYRDGFVRRGLPGQLLSWLVGGDPTPAAVTVFGLVLSACGAVAVTVLVWRLASSVPREAQLAAVTLLLVTPVGLPVALRDLGRYDALTFVALSVAAWAATRPRWWSPLAVSVAGVVATAAEEFAVAFLAPVVLVVAWRCGRARWPRVFGYAAAMLGPAGLVAFASLLVRPDPAAVAARAAAAHAAGVELPSIPGDDAASLLGASFGEQVGAFARYDPLVLAGLAVGLGVLAVAVGWLLWRLAGEPEPRLFAAAAGWLLLCAVGLGLVGVDYVRWWAMALLGFAALLAAGWPSRHPEPSEPRSLVPAWVVTVAVLACLASLDVPLEPPRLLG